VTESSAEHNQEFSVFDKFCLKKIDLLVYELRGYKESNRQTQILKTATVSSVSKNFGNVVKYGNNSRWNFVKCDKNISFAENYWFEELILDFREKESCSCCKKVDVRA
jgi:hypothetical protein